MHYFNLGGKERESDAYVGRVVPEQRLNRQRI